jgi:hypothetical protein
VWWCWPLGTKSRPPTTEPNLVNQTEFTEIEKFGCMFGSEFPETEFTEVNIETEPNLPEM